MPTFRNHVQKAVDTLGSQKALGDAIGQTQQYVWNLLHDAKQIKAEVAVKIEEVTGGKVSRSDLRPDLWPTSQSEENAA